MVCVLEEDVVLVGHGCQGPGEQGWHSIVVDHCPSSQEGLPAEGALDEHVYVVGNVRDSSSVAFGLPETSLYVFPVPFAGLDAELVEGSYDGNCNDLTLSLPEGLLGHVEVFSDGVGTGVPPADASGQTEVKTVVGKRVGHVEDTESVVAVHRAVNLVVNSGHDGHV